MKAITTVTYNSYTTRPLSQAIVDNKSSIDQSINLFGNREQVETIKCTSLSLSTRTTGYYKYGLH